jgi:hypothetical protein
MKYNIGDVVELNSMWDNRYGIIVELDKKENEYPSLYRIIIQGYAIASWMSEFVIVRKVD